MCIYISMVAGSGRMPCKSSSAIRSFTAAFSNSPREPGAMMVFSMYAWCATEASSGALQCYGTFSAIEKRAVSGYATSPVLPLEYVHSSPLPCRLTVNRQVIRLLSSPLLPMRSRWLFPRRPRREYFRSYNADLSPCHKHHIIILIAPYRAN